MSESWDSSHAPRRAPGPPPETLEGFSDWHQIGRGGDAIVYRARQDAMDREVAIKVLTVDDAESVRRFTREVQLMVALGREHPNIAKVLQIGTSSQGRPCIVMDYYRLGSLDKKLSQDGPLSADEVLGVGVMIADALAFAHSRGVLHRDVKPQNILILDDGYVLADFGIARLIDSGHTASSDRFSYRHASPQVLDGYPPSESDDVFSLGATMFHLLDGKPPFTTPGPEPDSALAYIKRVRIAEPRPLERDDVPSGLRDAIMRCLHKDAADRFRSALELRNQLAAVRGSEGTAAALLPQGSPGEVSLEPVEDATSLRAPVAAIPVHLDDAAANPDFVRPRRAFPEEVPPEPVPAPKSDPNAPRRRVPLLSIALGGVALGVLLVVVLWGLFRPFPSTDPAPSAAPSPGPSPGSTSPSINPRNPNLAPRGLQVIWAGDIATATWEQAIDEPDAYGWGVLPTSGGSVEIEGQTLPGNRVARKLVDPEWDQVCFTVVGVQGGEIGSDTVCATRD